MRPSAFCWFGQTMNQRLVEGCISKFESSLSSQRVRSLGCYFPVGENRRHSRRLGWGAPVSGPQFLAFRLLRGGFLAPVSGGYFPISVSGVQRPVRQQTESRLHPPRTSPFYPDTLPTAKLLHRPRSCFPGPRQAFRLGCP